MEPSTRIGVLARRGRQALALAVIGFGVATAGLGVSAASASAAGVSVQCARSQFVTVGLLQRVSILQPASSCTTPALRCPPNDTCTVSAYGQASDTAGGAGVYVVLDGVVLNPRFCRTAYSLIMGNSCQTVPQMDNLDDTTTSPSSASCIWISNPVAPLLPDFGTSYRCVLTLTITGTFGN